MKFINITECSHGCPRPGRKHRSLRSPKVPSPDTAHPSVVRESSLHTLAVPVLTPPGIGLSSPVLLPACHQRKIDCLLIMFLISLTNLGFFFFPVPGFLALDPHNVAFLEAVAKQDHGAPERSGF